MRQIHFTVSDKTKCGLRWIIMKDDGAHVTVETVDDWGFVTCKRCLKKQSEGGR